MTLASHLPRYDFNEVHSVDVGASPETVLAAVRALTPREVPMTVALMALRSVPALVLRQRHLLTLRTPVIEQFTKAGFTVLSERPEELVIGGIGRFWRPGGGLRRISPAEFASFDEPGFAKTAFDMRAIPHPAGARLTTETRILATDESARREFARYWRLIRLGSGAIRREWLRAIKRRAERAAQR